MVKVGTFHQFLVNLGLCPNNVQIVDFGELALPVKRSEYAPLVKRLHFVLHWLPCQDTNISFEHLGPFVRQMALFHPSAGQSLQVRTRPYFAEPPFAELAGVIVGGLL